MIVRMEAEGRRDTDRYRRAGAAGREVAELLARPERELLELGAAARLLSAGELDDARLLEAARPVGPDGAVRIQRGRVEAREEAMVRAPSGAGRRPSSSWAAPTTCPNRCGGWARGSASTSA